MVNKNYIYIINEYKVVSFENSNTKINIYSRPLSVMCPRKISSRNKMIIIKRSDEEGKEFADEIGVIFHIISKKFGLREFSPFC